MLAQDDQAQVLQNMKGRGLALECVAPVLSGAKYQLHNGSISTCLTLSENGPGAKHTKATGATSVHHGDPASGPGGWHPGPSTITLRLPSATPVSRPRGPPDSHTELQPAL